MNYRVWSPAYVNDAQNVRWYASLTRLRHQSHNTTTTTKLRDVSTTETTPHTNDKPRTTDTHRVWCLSTTTSLHII